MHTIEELSVIDEGGVVLFSPPSSSFDMEVNGSIWQCEEVLLRKKH